MFEHLFTLFKQIARAPVTKYQVLSVFYSSKRNEDKRVKNFPDSVVLPVGNMLMYNLISLYQMTHLFTQTNCQTVGSKETSLAGVCDIISHL